MSFTEDQGPVKQLAAQGPDDAFADSVHPRRFGQGGDAPQPLGREHFPERGGEQRVAVVNEEPQHAEAAIQVHGEVAGLLHRPGPGRVRGYSGQVQPAGAVLDEDQHVQPPEQRRLHNQEVTGDDRVRLGGQELPPGRSGPPGCRFDACGVQDLPYRGRGDRAPEPRELTLDPPVAQAGFSLAIWMIIVLTEVPVDGRPGRRRLV